MSKKLEKAISQILSQRNISDYYELLDEIKKVSNSKKGDDYIEELLEEYLITAGITDIAINAAKNAVIYREKLFANTTFRIQLTELEIQQRKMVVGHRFIPYIHPNVHPKNILLIDEKDNEILIKEEKASFIDALIWFSLLPPYGFQHYELDEENQIVMYVYDLTTWMDSQEFELEDNILISPIDYEKNIFRIKKQSRRAIAEQQILIRNKDEKLIKKLTEGTDMDEVMFPVDMQLFKALAFASDELLKEGGSPIGPLLSNNETLGIFNNGAYAYINAKGYEHNLMDMSLDEAMLPNLGDMGKAEDLEGILHELGNSFNKEFVVAKFVEQMHERKAIDTDEIFTILFKKGLHPFYNEQQESHFNKAISALAEEIEEEWKSRSLGLPMKRLLSKGIKFKVEIIDLLREIDEKIKNPEEFNFGFLMQLQPFEIISDQLLENIINDQEAFNPNLTKQLSKQMDQMKTEFQSTKNQILDNL